MSLKKHGLKALGLTFFAALALMAISAPGASATAGELLILNAAGTVSSELNATLTGKVDVLGVLDVPAINLEIDCTAFTVEEGTYLASDNTGHGKLLYSGCTAYGTTPHLLALAGCEIYPTAADRTAGTNKGHITAAALLLILLHTGASGNKTIVIAKPSAGGLFTKIFFKNCPTGTSADVTGELALLLNTTGHKIEHLGSVWVSLTTTHLGLSWGIV
jgi:hypothetical protein